MARSNIVEENYIVIWDRGLGDQKKEKKKQNNNTFFHILGFLVYWKIGFLIFFSCLLLVAADIAAVVQDSIVLRNSHMFSTRRTVYVIRVFICFVFFCFFDIFRSRLLLIQC